MGDGVRAGSLVVVVGGVSPTVIPAPAARVGIGAPLSTDDDVVRAPIVAAKGAAIGPKPDGAAAPTTNCAPALPPRSAATPADAPELPNNLSKMSIANAAFDGRGGVGVVVPTEDAAGCCCWCSCCCCCCSCCRSCCDRGTGMTRWPDGTPPLRTERAGGDRCRSAAGAGSARLEIEASGGRPVADDVISGVDETGGVPDSVAPDADDA
jgi:hypothetical protein